MKLKNSTSTTKKTYSSRFSLHEKVKIILEFCETGQQLTRSSTYKGYPVGDWASNIRYYKNLCETFSVSTTDDLVKFKNPETSKTLSFSTLSKIKSYLNLTPEELLKLANTNVLQSRYNSTAISIHEKVKIILDFCQTGQELTRTFYSSRTSCRSMGYAHKIF